MTVCRPDRRPFSTPPRPWRLTEDKLKRYRHFDRILSVDEATDLASSPERVATHAFFPLLRFYEVKRYYRRTDQPHKKPKKRPLRYAARSDAYIYMRYRQWLSDLYEQRLVELDLQDVPIAYRRIKSPYRRGNKCNIDFAFDAIQHIRRMRNCNAICIDISGFFEHLDHQHLKAVWSDLLQVEKLPLDHYRVFRNLTKHTVVDLLKLYRRLGFWGWKTVSVGRGKSLGRREVEGYLIDRHKIPVRLCSASKMREIVFGDGSDLSSIAETNKNVYGIPQGTPISDLLANIYMLGFDQAMKRTADNLGGVYMRYSDDILLIVPDEAVDPAVLAKTVGDTIRLQGDQLEISEAKTAIHRFQDEGTRLRCTAVAGTPANKRFEYLGFQFDGRSIRLRDATLSKLRQKMAKAVKREAITAARRYPDKSPGQICADFDFGPLYQRFGRVRWFERMNDVSAWNFWTYVRKIEETMGYDARPVMRQMRNQKEWIRRNFGRYVEGEAKKTIIPRARPLLAKIGAAQ